MPFSQGVQQKELYSNKWGKGAYFKDNHPHQGQLRTLGDKTESRKASTLIFLSNDHHLYRSPTACFLSSHQVAWFEWEKKASKLLTRRTHHEGEEPHYLVQTSYFRWRNFSWPLTVKYSVNTFWRSSLLTKRDITTRCSKTFHVLYKYIQNGKMSLIHNLHKIKNMTNEIWPDFKIIRNINTGLCCKYFVFLTNVYESFHLQVHVHTMCALWLMRPEENTACPGTDDIDGYEGLCGCWEPNLGPLQKQQVLNIFLPLRFLVFNVHILIPGLKRQRQADLWELEANLVYIEN